MGDEVHAIDGQVPRDIIEWRFLVDDADPVLDLGRGGLELSVEVDKRAGEPLGVEVQSALFDQVRTCDNHCEFCFIYQLPPGLRKSLYLKDDDYRLSFLYGNFTTLTRFTEADLERVVTERLSPLNVSIHATDPDVRTEMLRNRRGATSLRWLRALLDHGIEVHGQVVVCPGINDGAVLEDTLAGVLDRYPELASLCVVPLGVSRYNTEPRMRAHTVAEAAAVVDSVEAWQAIYLDALGRRLVYVGDEYYLLAERPFPAGRRLRGLRHARGRRGHGPHARGGAVRREGRRHRQAGGLLRLGGRVGLRRRRLRALPREPGHRRPAAAGAAVPAARRSGSSPAPTAPACWSRSSGASTATTCGSSRSTTSSSAAPPAVTGLLVGEDLARALAAQPEGHRYLLPDVCLSNGRFLDGTGPEDLPRPVEIIPTDGHALARRAGAGHR